jgi:RNA polymerase sigma-70 factor (ECF subfamily)
VLKQLEQGDSKALDKLIEPHYPEILRYCLWYSPNRSLAGDATQETFLKAIRYLENYVHQGKLKSFLYQIAANTCIDMRERSGSRIYLLIK